MKDKIAISNNELSFLKSTAYQIRKDVIDMIYNCPTSSGHFGGSLSAAEIITALYFKVLKIDPKNPGWKERDRFIISKGHSAPVLYAALARRGFYDEGLLKTYRSKDSILQGHPDCLKTPGVDSSSGSLGQGLSVALGIALSARHTGRNFKVYCLLSDGEMDSGILWEAAMAASHYGVSNLTAIIDYNHMQVHGDPKIIMNIEPLSDKWKSFGWKAVTVDGHDIESILKVFKLRGKYSNMPFVMICNTVKGKGVSFMENSTDWHSAKITQEQRNIAISELEKCISF